MKNKTHGVDVAELKVLYLRYLRALCPDWCEEQLQAETESVFREQGLNRSEQRRREFQESLVAKLEKIQKHPDDWFLVENGSRS